jgi:hypothetical protein
VRELNASVRLYQATGAAAQPESATPAADTALREVVEQLRAGARELADQVNRGAGEVAQLRAARDQARFRVRALEAELEPLRAELARERRNARGLRNQLEELRATIDAESADPIEPVPEEGWPADLLAGVTILLFTGQARAGAREAMADELREVGATVEVRETSGPRSIPDRVSGDCVIVADVRFMPHMWSDAVAECARRSGARHLEVRSGQGGIVRAVARALGRG